MAKWLEGKRKMANNFSALFCIIRERRSITYTEFFCDCCYRRLIANQDD